MCACACACVTSARDHFAATAVIFALTVFAVSHPLAPGRARPHVMSARVVRAPQASSPRSCAPPRTRIERPQLQSAHSSNCSPLSGLPRALLPENTHCFALWIVCIAPPVRRWLRCIEIMRCHIDTATFSNVTSSSPKSCAPPCHERQCRARPPRTPREFPQVVCAPAHQN